MNRTLGKMTKRLIWVVGLAIALGASSAWITGCGMAGEYGDGYEREYVLDGVKLIAPGYDAMSDDTHSQSQYTISPRSRLLLRLESLRDYTSGIRTATGNDVYLKVWAIGDAATVRKTLKVCPILKNWMMAATWVKAYPMPRGRWTTEGGDIDHAGCVTAQDPNEAATASNSTPAAGTTSGRGSRSGTSNTSAHSSTSSVTAPVSSDETGLMVFKVTRWFKDYPIARKQNFGLALISEAEVIVVGDLSGSFSPRMNWVQ